MRGSKLYVTRHGLGSTASEEGSRSHCGKAAMRPVRSSLEACWSSRPMG